MKRLAILGASGHGKVVADIAECCGWDEVIFFDDAWPEITVNCHWEVKGNSSALEKDLKHFSGVAIAIGNNVIRAQKLKWLLSIKAPVATLVHPSAFVSKYSKLGIGSVVMPNVAVNAYSMIGDGVILNTGCSIDHDCLIGDCVHISPGAHLAGGVRVGAESWLGIGCSVIQLVTLGRSVVVGSGAAVISDLPDCVKVVGIPARSI